MDTPRKILLGDDELLWGEDDVLDFLSQYGHAEVMTLEEEAHCRGAPGTDCVYLSVSGRRHCYDDQGGPYVCVSPNNSPDRWSVYLFASYDDCPQGDVPLLEAVKGFLEVLDEQARVG